MEPPRRDGAEERGERWLRAHRGKRARDGGSDSAVLARVQHLHEIRERIGAGDLQRGVRGVALAEQAIAAA